MFATNNILILLKKLLNNKTISPKQKLIKSIILLLRQNLDSDNMDLLNMLNQLSVNKN